MNDELLPERANQLLKMEKWKNLKQKNLRQILKNKNINLC